MLSRTFLFLFCAWLSTVSALTIPSTQSAREVIRRNQYRPTKRQVKAANIIDWLPGHDESHNGDGQWPHPPQMSILPPTCKDDDGRPCSGDKECIDGQCVKKCGAYGKFSFIDRDCICEVFAHKPYANQLCELICKLPNETYDTVSKECLCDNGYERSQWGQACVKECDNGSLRTENGCVDQCHRLTEVGYLQSRHGGCELDEGTMCEGVQWPCKESFLCRKQFPYSLHSTCC